MCLGSPLDSQTSFLFAWPFNTHAASAKSFQSCPTLCDSIDGSPLGSSVPGIQPRSKNVLQLLLSPSWTITLSSTCYKEASQTSIYNCQTCEESILDHSVIFMNEPRWDQWKNCSANPKNHEEKNISFCLSATYYAARDNGRPEEGFLSFTLIGLFPSSFRALLKNYLAFWICHFWPLPGCNVTQVRQLTDLRFLLKYYA